MKTLITFLAVVTFTFAQEEDPLKYFPYKTGHMWEYIDLQFPDTLQNFNIKDSIDAEGNIYITQFARRINPIQSPGVFPDTATYMIDTIFNVYGPYITGIGKIDAKLFKLDANQGDQWVIFDYSQLGGNGYEMCRINDIWEDEVIYGSGIYTTLKAFQYFYASDSTDTLGLNRYGTTLAYGFGIRSNGGDAFMSWILKGCVINDTLYGDTTNIITSVNDLSENLISDFKLYPNFPNPFNSETSIKFTIASYSYVELKVFDILGREVSNLLSEVKPPGVYEIIFNPHYLSSGTYIYTLKADNRIISKKMILLK